MATVPFLGEICVFPYNYAPDGWADCDGRLLQIFDYTALFSIIGTMYGGNGVSNFALPNFNGRAAMGSGAGQGLTPRSVGDSGGASFVGLSATQLPQHAHALVAYDVRGTDNDATPIARLARPSFGNAYGAPGAGTALGPLATATAGLSQEHQNRQPYLGMRYCIAMEGIYPSRS